MDEIEEFATAVGDLIRVVARTAMQNSMSSEYAPALAHLVRAQRSLRDLR